MANSAANPVVTSVPRTAGPMPGWAFSTTASSSHTAVGSYLRRVSQSLLSSLAAASLGMSLTRNLAVTTGPPLTMTFPITNRSGIAASTNAAIMPMVAMRFRRNLAPLMVLMRTSLGTTRRSSTTRTSVSVAVTRPP